MIGSHNDVLEQLVNAAESSLPDEFVALETRPIIADTRSPLLARRGVVRMALKSEETPLGKAPDTSLKHKNARPDGRGVSMVR
jgi:hypothetical protein